MEDRRFLEALHSDFKDYKREVARVFDQFFVRMDNLESNHFHHLQESLNLLENKSSKLETDIDWLKKAYWAVFTAAIGAFVAGVVGLFMNN